ncbi:hypothetical protein, partial [Vibrio penaeicida]
ATTSEPTDSETTTEQATTESASNSGDTEQAATESIDSTSTETTSESTNSEATTESASNTDETEQASTQLESANNTEQATTESEESTNTDTASETTSSEESILAYDDKSTLYNLSLKSEMSSIPENQSTQLYPRGSYGDGSSSSLIDKPLTWHIGNNDVVSINESGVLIGKERGTTTIWFTIDGLTSNGITITVTTGLLPCGGDVNDTDRYNAAGYCLKVIEGDSGEADDKLFTATPSIEVMKQLGYKLDDSRYNYGSTYGATYKESRIDGEFARFRYDGWGWENDPTSSNYGQGGQLDRYCNGLGYLKFMGRTNWKRPNRYELYSLVYHLGDLTANYGWPGFYDYWTNHPAKDSRFYSVDLVNNITRSHSARLKNYASCVSYND